MRHHANVRLKVSALNRACALEWAGKSRNIIVGSETVHHCGWANEVVSSLFLPRCDDCVMLCCSLTDVKPRNTLELSVWSVSANNAYYTRDWKRDWDEVRWLQCANV